MSEPKDRYDVGYGKPPKATQFQPGQSGNKRGRPKGAKGLRAELKEELDEYVTITSDGKSRRIRKRRLVIKALAAQAAKGNVSAADKLLALVIQAEGFEDQRPAAKPLTETDLLILRRMLAFGNDSDTPAMSDAAMTVVPLADQHTSENDEVSDD
jgi:Family of unknown function (DUF5681)